MIGQLLITLPLACVLFYGVLETRRTALLGVAISMLTVITLGVVWVPALVPAAVWASLVADREFAVLIGWIGLSALILLNLHLKLRRQLHVITSLARALTLLRSELQDVARQAAVPEPTEGHAVAAATSTDTGNIVVLKPRTRDRRDGRVGVPVGPGFQVAAPVQDSSAERADEERDPDGVGAAR